MDKALALISRVLVLGMAFALANCAQYKNGTHVLVSVKDQRMVLMQYGEPIKTYPVSTSKYGLGDRPGSNRTPIGQMSIYKKIGGGAPHGAVFKSRRRTGEIVRPNSPGRDPIVTRILWLEGEERSTRNARRRFIYIHGTPEERNIGRPVSYGCIRMTSRDVADLYKRVREETPVFVTRRGVRLAEVPKREKQLYAVVESRKQVPPPYVLEAEAELMAAAAPYSKASEAAAKAAEEERGRLIRR